MFMFVTYPWPVPSANADLAGPYVAVAAAHSPDSLAEAGPVRASQVEMLVRWTYRERLRMLWYRLRLTTSEIRHPSRQACESRPKLP